MSTAMKKTAAAFIKGMAPLALWAWLFRSYFLGQAVILAENHYYYSIVKFFYDNLRQGVFPLWSPFESWGMPIEILFNYIGLFNPMWGLTLLLHLAGLDLYPAFVVNLAVYYLIGVFGVRALAREWTRDSLAADLAFLLVLFSSFSITMFLAYVPVLIFVPSVWFFVHLSRFVRQPGRVPAVGMTFCLMLVLTSYLPYYFLTLFCFVLFWTTLLAPAAVGRMVKTAGTYAWRHKVLTAVCLLSLAFAALPGYRVTRSFANNDIVAPARHGGDTSDARNLEFTDYNQIKFGLSSYVEAKDLVENLDRLWYANEGMVYLPFFGWIVLGLGALNKIKKRTAVLLLTAVTLLFLMLSNATPLHRFLFDQVGFIRKFRNLHYYVCFLLALLALASAGQFARLREELRSAGRSRPVLLGGIAALHAVAVILLRTVFHNVIGTTYTTVLLSLVFWLALAVLNERQRTGALAAILLVGVAAQPVQVIGPYMQKALSHGDFARQYLPASLQRPVFRFVRPQATPGPAEPSEDHIRTAWCRLIMEDEPGFIAGTEPANPTRWTYQFVQKVPEAAFRPYVRNKILIYDRVAVEPEGEQIWGTLEGLLAGGLNPAVVTPGARPAAEDGNVLRGLLADGGIRPAGPARVIEGPAPDFELEAFTMNSLRFRTQFLDEKFLVYNDSYHPHWRAWVNGRPAPVYRANQAFKGLRLPAGRNEVVLRFHPPGGVAVYWLLLGLFYGYFLTLTALTWFPGRWCGQDRHG